MKSRFRIGLLTLLAFLPISGCGDPDNPSPASTIRPGTVEQNGLMAFPISQLGTAGDPIPYYDEASQTTYLYYLLNEASRLGQGEHPIALLTTKDFISYKDEGVVINYETPSSQDYLLGTGSVIKDQAGLYHFFYTGWNPNHSATVQYTEKVQHATSTDLRTWSKKPTAGFYGGTNDFRDPEVVYMAEKSEYWMLITTNRDGKPVLEKYVSKDLTSWVDDSVFYSGEGYNMECPTLLHYNGYWYLSFSLQAPDGTQERVTKYRYRKSLDTGSWLVPYSDSFDWAGLYAGKTYATGTDMYITGWTGERNSSVDNGSLGWGGNLVTHHLVQQIDGTLVPEAVSALDTSLSHAVEHNTLSESSTFDTDAIAFATAASEYRIYEGFPTTNASRVTFDLTSGTSGKDGIAFGVNKNQASGFVSLVFNHSEGTVALYPCGQDEISGKEPTLTTSLALPAGRAVSCELIVQGNVITLYVGGLKALTTKVYALPGKDFGFFGLDSATSFADIRFFE